jgi:TRAP-type C4-dicarboxylate transport system permease small subunit
LQFVKLGLDEKSPALRISMGLVFASMVLTGLLLCIFTIEEIHHFTKKVKNNK